MTLKSHTPAIILLLVMSFLKAGECTDAPSIPIVSVIPDVANVAKWDESNGDTADPFWADDDLLYHFQCDGRGFGTSPRNLCFNKLNGNDLSSLKGELVNAMDEYGTNGASMNGTSKNDGANWKVTGQECIDGVFYGFVARNQYGNRSKDPLLRQNSINASLIKSADRGLTWNRSAKENYDTPMWPGSRFGAPAFIHFGRNGGSVTRDGANTYVYAISNNGFWNGGDDMILGRVRRTDLPKLNATDWEYFTGGDGMVESSWNHDISKASPIITRPAKLGWTAPVFIPAMNRYLMVSWYITPTLKAWFTPECITYDFLEAAHPWGPWTQVGSMDDRFLGSCHMYGPNLCAKYQESTADGVTVQLFTSGCPFPDKPGSLYKNWRFPIIVKSKPTPEGTMINDNDPAITYSKNWQVVAQNNSRDFQKDAHYTRSPEATAEYSFTGTGVEVLTQKYQDSGSIDIFLDNVLVGSADLKLQNFPRLFQVPVFRVDGLPLKEHKIKIVTRGNGSVSLDAFRVLK